MYKRLYYIITLLGVLLSTSLKAQTAAFTPDTIRIDSLSTMATKAMQNGQYEQTIRLTTEALSLLEKNFGPEYLDVPAEKDWLGIVRSDELCQVYSMPENLLELLIESYEAFVRQNGGIRLKQYANDHPFIAKSLYYMADFYGDPQYMNYDRAVRLCTTALNLQIETDSTDIFCAYILSKLAKYACIAITPNTPIQAENIATDLYRRLLGTNHPTYAASLCRLAHYYYVNDEHRHFSADTLHNNLPSGLEAKKQAVRLGRKALDIYRETLGENHISYILTLADQMILEGGVGNNAKVLECGQQAIDLYRKRRGYTSGTDDLAFILGIANRFGAAGERAEAVRLLTGIRQSLPYGDIDSEELADELICQACELAVERREAGLYQQAIDLMQLARNEYDKEPNKFTWDDERLSSRTLAMDYAALGQFSQATDIYAAYTDEYRQLIIDRFKYDTATERNNFWNEHCTKFSQDFPLCVFHSKTKIGDLYNKSALFAKGLLLTAETELHQLIVKSGNIEARKLYEQLHSDNLLLDKLRQDSRNIKENKNTIDSLQSAIYLQEQKLTRISSDFGDYTRNLTLTWQDIQSNLRKGDIAIEFLSFPVSDYCIKYIALTLKKGYDNPHMIPITEESLLNAIQQDQIYTTADMSKLVWQPLQDELKGVTTVYFSPTGKLHNIGIEYLPLEDGSNIAEKHTLYRLSSTRQIARQKQEPHRRQQVVLYGGIDYDANFKSIQETNHQYETYTRLYNSTDSSLRMFKDTELRNGCGFLPGTEVEVTNIAKTLDNSQMNHTMYIHAEGTEESFYDLPNKKPTTIHIATHGFYWTEAEAAKVKKNHQAINFLRTDSKEEAGTEAELAMTRSGLMMAGSNHIINGETLPCEMEDGILTAKEISQVSFDGLELVVLSACQTALGHISGSEGVFGLQRAFKKAGAQAILMSLWQVDDTATEIMMTEFYQNLAQDMPLHQAFRKAQQTFRDIDEDPKHWAAFILLDAME